MPKNQEYDHSHRPKVRKTKTPDYLHPPRTLGVKQDLFGEAHVTGRATGEKRIARAVRIRGNWHAEVIGAANGRFVTRDSNGYGSKEMALRIAINKARVL